LTGRRSAAALLGLALVAVTASPAQPGGAQDAPAPRLTVTALAVPATTIVTGISFPDPAHGYAVAADNSVFATVDGGQSWASVPTPLPVLDLATAGPSNGLIDVDFTDAEHGHIVTSGDKVLATSDGGKSWVVQPTPRPSEVTATWPFGPPSAWNFNAIDFVDRDNGFAVGSAGVILATGDGGATWTYQGNPGFGQLFDVAFIDAQHGEIAGDLRGRDEDAFTALATADGGKTWAPQRAGGPADPGTPVNFLAVALTEPRHAVVAGRSGRIFVTFDAGRTWRNRRSGTEERLNSVAFADSRRGLAVGEIDFQGELRAQILATNDGGQSWTQRPSPEAAALSEATFADPTTAYVVGCATAVGTCRKGTILRVDFPVFAGPVDQESPSSGLPFIPLLLVALAVAVVFGGIRLARHLE